MKPIVLIHGWSADSTSLEPMAKWLQAQGFNTVEIWLADYLSMNDEITISDLARALVLALADKKVPQTHHGFDAVVHSTGGLVIREYLKQVCQGNAQVTPVEHLLMCAPANFGSPLAKLGKSYVSRVFNGWSWDHTFQTGTCILNALELASPYAWKLAEYDLFNPGFPVFAPGNTMVTVLVGTIPYPGVKGLLHENGSDGTVRVSTANLNAHYWRVDFENPGAAKFTDIRPNRANRLGLGVFHRNHSSILNPQDPAQKEVWGEAVIRSLTITPADYERHCVWLDSLTDQTFREGEMNEDSGASLWYHRYQHVALRVRDQYGEPVNDYVVEFFQYNDPEEKAFSVIHKEILAAKTRNEVEHNYRSLLIDTTKLVRYLGGESRPSVRMSLAAVHPSSRITYRNPPRDVAHGLEVFAQQRQGFITPNEPVLIDMTLYRDPAPEVLKLKKQA